MIKTVLEETVGATKIVIEEDCGHYFVHLLNAPRKIMCVYSPDVGLESDRALNPREMAETINLCEWCINRTNSKHVGKRTIAKVAETCIELLYKGGCYDD